MDATAAAGTVQPLPLNKQLGENGSPEYTSDGVEDPRVALFFALVRGITRDRVNELLDKSLERADLVADAIVMAFQTRNCRGGKGERELFYFMVLHLYKTYPKTVADLIQSIPHYGTYKDWFQLISLADEGDSALVDSIYTLAVEQLRKDREVLASGKKGAVSLLAKWAPRESKAFDKQASVLAKKLFPGSSTAKKEYRKLLASLNKELNTTEIRMCANQWDTIDFGNVPSVAMLKYRKAFLNEKVKSVPTASEEETGNRHPDKEVRINCRKRLREEILQGKACKLKGKQLFPHEIVSKFWGGYSETHVSTLEADLLQRQWEDIRENVKLAMSEATREGTSPSVDLGKLVAVADVSGSMSGIPMLVSIALSILVSELAAPEFANRFLTFSQDPTWVTFADGASLAEKTRITARAPWGMNTDFTKAMNLILDTAVKANLKPDEIPDLIVFSDMQFDSARTRSGDWETHYERLVRKYKEAGLKACGIPWSPPHIIFWNLRGDTRGSPAAADTEGVTMLSGFSPSLLKLLLAGETELEAKEVITEVINEDGDVVVVKEKVKKTPYDTLRLALDDVEYNKVREVLGKSVEGLLVDYEFEPVPAEDDEWVMDA